MSVRLHTALAVALVASACSSPDDASGDLHLVVVQAPTTATPGGTAAQDVLVKVVNGDGTAVPGIPVQWSIRTGGGRITPGADSTGVDGLASAQWTAGLTTGTQEIGVTIYDQPALVIAVASEALHVDKIATAYTLGCGLQATTVWCWQSSRPTPGAQRVSSPFPVHDLAITSGYLCVLDGAGTAYCRFILGDLTTGAFEAIPGLPELSHISGGGAVFCGISRLDSTPWCWRHFGMSGVQVSSSLQLASITPGSNGACGLTASGAAWCWDMLSPGGVEPAPVPGGHSFRTLAGENELRCAIEGATQLYCWTGSDPEPRAVVGTFAPTAVALGGVGNHLMSSSSGASVFYFNYDQPGTITPVPGSDFPLPVAQLAEGCLRAFDSAVYCVNENYSSESGWFYTWTAVAAPPP